MRNYGKHLTGRQNKMGVQWTKEQQEVIRLRDRNILVSAAAGSGKTAVLVERILSKITDKKHPVDIDRLLIMTFTRAAAGEMKERISAAIEKALCEDPDNEHLQRQTTLLHTAQITTIDGFCAYIIRNYFHLIGLDPGYRTADEGELKLLRGDVVKALLEEYYARKDEKFQKFVECFATGKSDENLGNLIQKLYEMAMSNPFPQEWLSGCMDDYRIDSLEELRETEWMRMLWDAVKDELQEAKLLVQEARRICSEPDGPYLYDEALSSDLLLIRSLQELAEKRDYNGTAEILMKPSFARLSTKKAADVDEQKKQRVKDLRDEEKGILKELGQRYFQSAEKELLEVIRYIRGPIEMLVELTARFKKQFGEAKREKNILDFTDMEHFALQILMTKEGEEIHMSQAARELSAKYDEVLVDEYQDSNLVQELLTTAVSGWINQKKNIFMVGDVKQSIYRFRLARPELFMEKYEQYSLTDSTEQRIDLHKNFRSRSFSRRSNSSSDGRNSRWGRCSMTNSVRSLGSRSPSTQEINCFSRSGCSSFLLIPCPLQRVDLLQRQEKEDAGHTGAHSRLRNGQIRALEQAPQHRHHQGQRHIHDYRCQQPLAQRRCNSTHDHPDQQDVFQNDHRTSTSHSFSKSGTVDTSISATRWLHTGLGSHKNTKISSVFAADRDQPCSSISPIRTQKIPRESPTAAACIRLST